MIEIDISKSAREKFLEFLDSEGYEPDVAGIRIQVKPGGCAGFQYGLQVELNPENDDFVIEHNKIRLYVDAFSAPYLDGILIDWQESMMGQGFTFDNPNATGGCGCGTSFEA